MAIAPGSAVESRSFSGSGSSYRDSSHSSLSRGTPPSHTRHKKPRPISLGARTITGSALHSHGDHSGSASTGNDEKRRQSTESNHTTKSRARVVADLRSSIFRTRIMDYPPEDMINSAPTSTSLLPDRPRRLERGLQIPSRMGIITSGFSLPRLLEEQGVSKPQWKLFTHELKSHAKMSGTQWIFGWGMEKMEYENLVLSHNVGALDIFVKRWNKDFFNPLGLQVLIALPGMGHLEDSDVSSTKLFKYQQRYGITSPAAGQASTQDDPKESRYLAREGRQRVKAGRKGRIIILPFNNSAPAESGLVSDGGNGHVQGEKAGDRHNDVGNHPNIQTSEMGHGPAERLREGDPSPNPPAA